MVQVINNEETLVTTLILLHGLKRYIGAKQDV